MYPRSSRFDDAVRWGAAAYGATPISRIDAYRAGTCIAPDLPWGSPSTITVDEGASAWRTCEITILDMDRALVPTTPQAALAPYGTDLFIQTGFAFDDGTQEMVPMGVFRIIGPVRPTRKGRITLLGYDYSRVVARARFEVPRVFPRGYRRVDAIRDLISERTTAAGPAGHNILTMAVGDSTTLPLTIFEEGERYGDPWKACMDIADSNAQQVFFLPNGPYPQAVLRPQPDLVGAPEVWVYDSDAGDGSTAVDMKLELDASTGYNVYVVSGESSELASLDLIPVRASAEVTDASSPIYPSIYGRVPVFLASSFIKTEAQCLAVARANLPLKAGGSEQLTITGFSHPCHEAGDVVRARDAYLGIDSPWIISRFSIDLSLKSSTDYTCRARRVA